MTDSQNSLLAALGVTGQEINLAGHTFKVYEFTVQQFGELLAVLESSLQKAAVTTDVVDLVNQTTTQRLTRDWVRFATESREFIYHMLAFGLGVSLDEARAISVKHLPALVREIAKVNASFFGELREMVKDIANIFPAAAGINLAMERAMQVAGHDTSPSPDEQVTA